MFTILSTLSSLNSFVVTTIYIYIYNSKSLDVVQSLYFGSLLQKYRDCTTSNDFELYLMCCGVMLLLLIIYIYIYIWTMYNIFPKNNDITAVNNFTQLGPMP